VVNGHPAPISLQTVFESRTKRHRIFFLAREFVVWAGVAHKAGELVVFAFAV